MSDIEFDRTNPEHAAEVIESLCASEDDRMLILGQLLRSIAVADSVGPQSWAATLFGNGFRLNVGAVEALTFLDGQVSLFLHGSIPSAAQRLGKVVPCSLKIAPHPSHVFIGGLSAFREQCDHLASAHEAYVRGAAVKSNGAPRRTSFARYHSPGLHAYATRIAGETAQAIYLIRSATIKRGWLMSLRHSEKSNWGDVASFYRDIASYGRGRVITVTSKTWGKLNRKEPVPRPGDGFGFYHSTRARMPDDDAHPRTPRISLIGELSEVKVDGLHVQWISVKVNRAVLEAMRATPILRDPQTEHIFQQSGIVQGAAATLYGVSSPAWSEIESLAGVSSVSDLVEPDNELTAFEGRLQRAFRAHRIREASLRTAKIASVIATMPDHRLRCEVPGCDFDFEEVYGGIGHQFAEVHHLRALSDSAGQVETRLSDLAVVCANCHRMIHRGGANRPLGTLIRSARSLTSPRSPRADH